MRKLIIAGMIGAACSLTALAQTIAITNAKIHPVSGPAIARGTVLIRDGAIVAVGADVSIPENAQRIDGTGKVVTPGLINSLSELGIIEIDQIRSTNDASARGQNNIAASFRVWDGLNPTSALFGPARNEGITSAVIAPRGGLVSGQAAAIDLVSGRADEMIRRAAVAMVSQVDDANAAGTSSRGELISKLRTLFEDVKFYAEHQRDYERAASRPLSASQADLEALAPILNGRMLLLIDANRVDEIDAALALARDYNLRIGITGGAEAWLRAERLAAARVPVFTGAMNNIPDSFATLNQRQENAALLRRAGVQVVITGGGDVTRYNARNIKYEAGNAVAYGMDHEDALRSLTLTPAEIFGFSDRVGSLQAGRDANLVIWSGDPFEFSTVAEQVFIRGRQVKEPSRQDLLIERYKPRPGR